MRRKLLSRLSTYVNSFDCISAALLLGLSVGQLIKISAVDDTLHFQLPFDFASPQ